MKTILPELKFIFRMRYNSYIMAGVESKADHPAFDLKPSNIVLYGPARSGKTVLVKHIISVFQPSEVILIG